MPTVAARRFTVPEALAALFGSREAGGCEYLRNTANTFTRKGGVTETVQEPSLERTQRKKRTLAEDQLPALYNAILLHALVADTARVKKAFRDRKARNRLADDAAALFGQRNSLMGIALSRPDATNLVVALKGDLDLSKERLPNPFSVLPQLHLGGDLGLLHGVLAQAGALSTGDSMLLAHLRGEKAVAYQKAMALDPASMPGELALLREVVIRAWREQEEFSGLLRHFRPERPSG